MPNLFNSSRRICKCTSFWLSVLSVGTFLAGGSLLSAPDGRRVINRFRPLLYVIASIAFTWASISIVNSRFHGSPEVFLFYFFGVFLIIPIGINEDQKLMLYTKTKSEIIQKEIQTVKFVPLLPGTD